MVEKSNLEIMLGHILAALNEMTEVDNEVNLESAKELCKELLDEDYFQLSEHIMDFIVDMSLNRVYTNFEPKDVLDIWSHVAHRERDDRLTDLKCLFNLITGLIG